MTEASSAITRSAVLTVFLSASVATAALAQAPSSAQRAAIKSQCRSDYMAHCASVPPGGAASLQCLQENMASLAPGCQAAVRAVAAPSETKTGAEPAAATPPAAPAAETKATPAASATTATQPAAPAASATGANPAPPASTAATKPSSAQIAAIRSACRIDYPKLCAGVPTGGAAALRCLAKNEARLSSTCQAVVAAASGGGAASAKADAVPAAAPASAAASPAPRVMVLRPMRPREVIFVMRSACGADVRTYCAGTDPGGGRIGECLARNASSLSPACRTVLSQFAAH